MQNMVQGADVKQESLLKFFGNILTQIKGFGIYQPGMAKKFFSTSTPRDIIKN